MKDKTESIWTYVNSDLAGGRFLNPNYYEDNQHSFDNIPLTMPNQLKLWSDLYFQYSPFDPLDYEVLQDKWNSDREKDSMVKKELSKLGNMFH